MLRELLPLYRVITTVRVHNGRSTSFWDDSWLGDEPLSEIHPALHSHATKPHATVAEVLQFGIDQFLQSRRTRAATADYTALAPLLATVLPGSGEDERVCKFQKPDGSLNTSSLYKALMAAHTPSCEFASFVWKNRHRPESSSSCGYSCNDASRAGATSSRSLSSRMTLASCAKITLRQWTTSSSTAQWRRPSGDKLVSS